MAEKDKVLAANSAEITSIKKASEEKAKQISQQNKLVTGLKGAIAKTTAQLKTATERLSGLDGELAQMKAAIADKDVEISEKDGVIAELETRLGGTDQDGTSPAGEADASIESLRSELYSANYMIQERDMTIKTLRREAQKSRSRAKSDRKAISSLEQHRMILGGAVSRRRDCRRFRLAPQGALSEGYTSYAADLM